MVHSFAANAVIGVSKVIASEIDMAAFENLFKCMIYLYFGPDVSPGFNPTSSLLAEPLPFFVSSAGDFGLASPEGLFDLPLSEPDFVSSVGAAGTVGSVAEVEVFLLSPDLVSEGFASAVLLSPGLLSAGLDSPDFVSPGFDSAGLLSPGAGTTPG